MVVRVKNPRLSGDNMQAVRRGLPTYISTTTTPVTPRESEQSLVRREYTLWLWSRNLSRPVQQNQPDNHNDEYDQNDVGVSLTVSWLRAVINRGGSSHSDAACHAKARSPQHGQIPCFQHSAVPIPAGSGCPVRMRPAASLQFSNLKSCSPLQTSRALQTPHTFSFSIFR
jgi:hypothetical protein